MPTLTPPSEWELTSDEIRTIQKRAQLRATTKAEFLKRYRNPFYHMVPGHFVSPRELNSAIFFEIGHFVSFSRLIRKMFVSMLISRIAIVIYTPLRVFFLLQLSFFSPEVSYNISPRNIGYVDLECKAK